MEKIILRGREIPLLYTSNEMKTIQEEIAPLHQVFALAIGRNPDDKEDTSKYGTPEHIEALGKLIRILGNAGLEENGQEPDLTDKKVMRSIRPADVTDVGLACLNAMNEGMMSEIPPEKKEGPVDVTLEEINKKKEKED